MLPMKIYLRRCSRRFDGILILYETHLKIEVDNPRQFDCKCRSINVKNAKFNWTRTAMSLKFPTFSRRFRTLLSLGGPTRLSNRRGVQINVWNCTFPKTNKRWVSNKRPGPFKLLNFIVE